MFHQNYFLDRICEDSKYISYKETFEDDDVSSSGDDDSVNQVVVAEEMGEWQLGEMGWNRLSARLPSFIYILFQGQEIVV